MPLNFTGSLVHWLSLLLWMAVIAVIFSGVCRGTYTLVRRGYDGIAPAREQVASSIIGGLGLSTAIALLATTQLRSWSAIGMFAATAGLRTLVKFAERFSLKHAGHTGL